MTFANKYGRKNVTWKVTTSGRKYYKLADLAAQYEEGHTFVLDSMFINTKSYYGNSPVAGVADPSEPFMVNLPAHLMDQVNAMLNDPEAIEAIQLGKAGFKIRTYSPKGSNRICYTVDWVDADMDDLPF